MNSASNYAYAENYCSLDDSPRKYMRSPPLYVFESYFQREIEKIKTDPWKTVQDSAQSLLVIIPTVLGFTLAQLLCQHLPLHSTWRFLLEFLVIAAPVVCNITWASEYNGLYCCVVTFIMFLILWPRLAAKPKDYFFQLEKRPIVFTLLRSTAYVGTGVAILAVDFEYFPFEYRKSRTYGASIMDMGIGLFVVTMGMVSHRARNWSDIKGLHKAVIPLLVLGLARTLVITAIDYHQDEHEYGKHLNAFFILGLTKLFGSLLSLLARSDNQLLLLGVVLLVVHESILQLGLCQHIINDPERIGFFDSNREGFSSLPGAAALYLLSIYGAKWYMSKNELNKTQYWSKLYHMLSCAIALWTLVVISAFECGIIRATFNTGYVAWLLAVCTTLLLFFSFLFEFALSKDGKTTDLPSYVESLNMNGLTYFMITNLLTGVVNMTLLPHERDLVECMLILMFYMLISTGLVYILFRRGIRIA